MAEPSPSDRLEALLAHREWARGLARSLVRDDAEAADLEQEVWLSAVRRPPGDASSPRGWLATALRHALSNLRRGRRRRGVRERAAARPEAAPAADAVVAEAEAHRRVVDAVMDLEEPYRTAVLLRFFEGLDLPAVAARTGVPPETARTRLKRARERLRARLGDGDRRRALGLVLLPLLREAPPVWSAPLVPVAGGIAMTLKMKAAVGACAALLLLLVGAALLGGDGPPPPPVETADAPPEEAKAPPSAPLPPPPPPPPSPPPPPAVEHVLRVRVLDEEDRPVAGARFLLGMKEDTLAADGVQGKPWEMGTTRGRVMGREVEVGAGGRWERRFPGPRQVVLWVSAMSDPGLRPAGEPGAQTETWVDTPAPDVVLRVRRVPTADLVVRVVDLSTGRAAGGFQVAVKGSGSGAYLSLRAEGETLETKVAVPEGGAALVSLLDPKPPRPVEEEVALAPGGRSEVTLRYRSGASVRGRVVGPDGLPVPGAFVWLGGQEVARGDEPFKPFQAQRVRGGTRTDSFGQFEVRGPGVLVSAWHEDLSPATVPVDEASEIRLAARGTIRGVIVDGNGYPRAGVPVVLDRTAETATAEDGSFAFDRVEAGPRGLLIEKRRWVVVRVPPGGEVRPEIGPGIGAVEIRLQAGGRPWRGAKGVGVLVPLGSVGTMHEIRNVAEYIRVEGVIPGPYLLLGAEGHFAVLNVDGPRVEHDLGTATLIVRAPPRSRVFVHPVGKLDDPLVDLLVRRIQRIEPSKEGGCRVAPLPAREVIVEAGEGAESERRVRLLASGTETTVEFRPREEGK